MSEAIQFSQASLQDYVDCPRRYQLRYRLMLPWPPGRSSISREAEQHLLRGAAFHRLIHQHYCGIETARLGVEAASDPVLQKWWETFLQHPPAGIPTAYRRAEAVVSAPVAGHRLVARLDLIAIEPGAKAMIVDWKTSIKKPARSVLEQRVQTRVYQYLVAAVPLGGGNSALEPEQIEMVYWFCEFDGYSEYLSYNSLRFADDEAYLASLTTEIAGRGNEVWPLTPCEERCLCCGYRSLCGRRDCLDLEIDDMDLYVVEAEPDIEQIIEAVF